MASLSWPLTPSPHRQALRESWLAARARTVTVVLAAVAALTRLLYWFSMRDQPLTSDAGQYHELASNLVSGLGYSHQLPQLQLHPTAFRPPLYPFVLSFVYRVFGATQANGRALGVLIGVAVVVATVLVVRRHVGHLAAAVAGGAVALSPWIMANDIVTLTEGLSLLLLIVLADSVLHRRAVAAGVLCGLLVLSRPTAQFLVLVLAAWFVWKVDWRRAAVVVVVAGAVVAPWVVRNQVELGAPVIVTTNGFNLAAMYGQPAQDVNNFRDPLADPYYDDLRLDQFDEARWDAKLRQRALRDLRANPAHVVKVVLRNTGALLELTPRVNGIAEVIDGRNIAVRNAALPLFYVVTVAGVVGLWRWRRHPMGLLVILVGSYFVLGNLVLIAAPRLRAPADLVICIGVGLLVAGRPGEADGADEPAELGEDQTSPAKVSV